MAFGRLKGKLNRLKFRLNVRDSLQQSDFECVMITYEECKKEIERRNKKK